MAPSILASIVSAALLLVASGCGVSRVKPDQGVSPAAAGDSTAIVEGCGNQPVPGFTYCRFSEGELASQSLSFVGPPADCPGESCVFVKVFNQAGQLAWGGSIPKGNTRVSIPWKTLLATDRFQLEMRGAWSFVIRVLWRDTNGHDRVSVAKGDVFLRVLPKAYQPLNAVSSDPNFGWEWREGGHRYRMTSSLRSSVEAVRE